MNDNLSTDPSVEAFVQAARGDLSGTGFILDFDGTLSPIAPTPAEARPAPGADAVLSSLAARYALVAILSGRRAADVQGLIPVAGVRYIGLYGDEEFGAPPPASPAARVLASGLAEEARAFIDRESLVGARVEDKGMSVALHYRGAVSPEVGVLLGRWASQRAQDLGLALRPGRMVVELTPPGSTKADAVERVIRHQGLRRAVLAGDDVSDMGSLRRAGEMLGSAALRIGVSSSEAPPVLADVSDVVVPGPQGVVELLARFA